MNVILAIETCVPEATVALWENGEMLSEQEFVSDRNHNSMVFDALEKTLAVLDGGKLDLVIIGTGPGSYSGTRIGIAAGQGVAIAHGCPAVGLGSFAATHVARENAQSMAVGDARRGLYFISRIQNNGEALAPELMEYEEFQEVLQKTENETIFTFDPPESLHLADGMTEKIVRVRPESKYLIDIWQGLEIGRRNELLNSPLTPVYLRAPFTSKAKPGHPLIR